MRDGGGYGGDDDDVWAAGTRCDAACPDYASVRQIGLLLRFFFLAPLSVYPDDYCPQNQKLKIRSKQKLSSILPYFLTSVSQ